MELPEDDHGVNLACSEEDEYGVIGEARLEAGVPESRRYNCSCHSAVGTAGMVASWLETSSRDNLDCRFERRSSYEAAACWD